MKRILLLTVGLLGTSIAFGQLGDPGVWLTHGQVNNLTRGDGKVFLSGDFNWIGEGYDGNAPVLNLDLSHDVTYPEVPDRVQVAIPDDAGGWYTLGQRVFGHLKANKTYETLPIAITGGNAVYGIAKSGNVLYFGGQFNEVNGAARANVAAYDLTTNTLTAWNPGTVGTVYSVAVFGSTVYIGGSFTTVGGLTRHKMAAIDASTGTTTAWNVNAVTSFGYVLDIIPTAGAVYFGGSFTNIGGGSPSRRNFAVVNTTTGALLPFNPRPDDVVHDLLLDGTTMYIAGEYFLIGGVSRYGLTAFDTGTGSMLPFNPVFSETYGGPVVTMVVDGTKLYVGGDFLSVNNVDKGKIAVLDKTTGSLISTVKRHFSHTVHALSIEGSKILAGCYGLLGLNGDFSSKGLGAVDEVTGHGFDWVPQVPAVPPGSYINETKLHYQDDRLFFWQDLKNPDAATIGALNPDDGSLDAGFTVDVVGRVNAWGFTSDALFIAGNFSQVNGTARSNFAAVSIPSGDLLPFTIPSSPVNGIDVEAIAVDNNRLYASGNFVFEDGGITRTNLAAWNATTGELLPWAPQVTFSPLLGPIHNGRAYLMGGDCRRVNAITGVVDSWIPDYHNGTDEGGVYAITIQGNYVYIAGGFSPGLTRVGISTGSRTTWQPAIEDVYDSEGSIRSVITSENKLYVGGNFSFEAVDGVHGYYGQFELPAEVVNHPPQIISSTHAMSLNGVVTIDLTQLISDEDDNLDLNTLSLLNEVSAQGAAASLGSSHVLTLEYDGTTPSTDMISIEVCDFLEACAQQEVAIELGSLTLTVYNAVSPNGDGLNDQLTLLNIPAENRVTIFNRWGVSVCEIENYDNQTRAFNGLSSSGDELPSGTYYYRIDFPGGQETKTGYLSLRR